MPYVGEVDGTKVIPPEVNNDVTVICPSCSDEMSVVRSHHRGTVFISRHFRHHTQHIQQDYTTGQSSLTDHVGVCPGESDEHAKMKSISYAKLVDKFPDADVQLEKGVDGRIADVLLEFASPREPYGNGIAVEVQYRNVGKDIEEVTAHYLERGYSVIWLEEEDFDKHDVDLSGILTLWPYAVPARVGTEGYDDVIRWLLQPKSPSVELEIPIPAEYWMEFNRSDDWVTVAQRYLRQRGRAWATISRSPTGHLTLQLGKKDWGWNADSHRVTIQLARSDCKELRAFADELEQTGFESDVPSKTERKDPWHDLTTAWLAGSPNVTAWLSASLSPEDNVVLTLGKKHPVTTDTVTVQVDRTAVKALQELADLLERAFEIELD